MCRERFRAVAIAAGYGVSAVAYAWLPPRVPPHLALGADFDWWAGRAIIALLLPTAALVVCALYRHIEAGDPLRDNYPLFRTTLDLVLNAAVLFIVLVHATLLATILAGPAPWIGRIPPVLVGVTLVLVGNVLPRLRPNLALGIRTRATLGSDRVWARTHRLAGYLVVLFGVIVLLVTFLAPAWLAVVLGAGVALSVAVPVLASRVMSSGIVSPNGPRR